MKPIIMIAAIAPPNSIGYVKTSLSMSDWLAEATEKRNEENVTSIFFVTIGEIVAVFSGILYI